MEPSKKPDSAKPKKETARDIRKRKKRLEESRDALQEKNRTQAKKLKAARGKIDDLETSRDAWKHQCEQKEKENKSLEKEVISTKKSNKELEDTIKEQAQQNELERKAQEEEKAQYEQKIAELKKKLKILMT